MIENTNTKQFYPGPILNNTLEITDFLFNDAEQIKIKHSKLNEEGILIDIDLNYPTDYEVTKVLPSDINAAEAALTASTGQIMLKNVNVLAGEKLTVYRVSLIIQDKDYPRTGAFPAATHEGALDYLTMQNQEQKDEIDRALKVPISTQNFEGSLPLPIPSRALKINNDGTGFEMSEFDPDLALVITEEFKNQAQQAAIEALSSQTAAANSETVAIQQSQNATTQAANAKASADNAAELNQQLTTNYNTYSTNLTNAKNEGISALTNASNALRQTQITNCLLEVPQNIKLELKDGVLTLKAGSVVTVPNGFEADGTTPKFDYVTIESDVTTGFKGYSFTAFACYYPQNNYITLDTVQTTITSTGNYNYYNVSENLVQFINNGSVQYNNGAFPIAIVTLTSEQGVTSIDQVFNGFGYIGSTVWVDKGVKGLLPNGRNEDGTLNNIEIITQKVSTVTNAEFYQPILYVLSGYGMIANSTSDYWIYDEASNHYKHNNDIGHFVILAQSDTTSGVISNFQPSLPVKLVQSNELEECQVVVETYQQGTSWYRVWSDGFCIQSAYSNVSLTGGSTNISFLKTYRDAQVTVFATPVTNSSTNSYNMCSVASITNTGFALHSQNSVAHTQFWIAYGYIR